MVDASNDEVGPSGTVTDELVNTTDMRFHYEVGTFVAVLTDASEQGDEFWIGKITEVKKGRSNRMVSLYLHWFGHYGGTSLYISKYRPEMLLDQGVKKKAWIGEVSTDSVLVSFKKLTNEKKLPSAVSTHLREHFSSRR